MKLDKTISVFSSYLKVHCNTKGKSCINLSSTQRRVYKKIINTKAEGYLQFTSRGVVETSFPLCLLVSVVDCFIGEKCLVVDGV